MAWSPDGRKIVFRRTYYQTYMIDADGSNETLLRSDSGDPSGWQLRAHFSPDGSKVVTHHGVISFDGSDFFDTRDRRSWTPDGSKILFGCGRDLICTADDDGSAQRELHYGFSPAWSPDGSKIAFISGEHAMGDLLVMSSQGEDVTLLTDGSAQARFPKWSPDGLRILFVTGLTTIEVINADGTKRIILTNELMLDMDNHQPTPSWSPDGSKIVFTRAANPYTSNQTPGDLAPEICTVNTDGSGLNRLTEGGMSLGPIWSPTSE
jgi:Tol biopolymer transport system component